MSSTGPFSFDLKSFVLHFPYEHPLYVEKVDFSLIRFKRRSMKKQA